MSDQAQRLAWNTQVIEEFRANEGVVGGQFQGSPLLLLTTTGARSGLPRTMPLAYVPDGDLLVVFAANGGRPTHPGWYHNLCADPRATVEVGTERFQARATPAEGAAYERLWAAQVARMPMMEEFRERSGRRIPVMVLERAG